MEETIGILIAHKTVKIKPPIIAVVITALIPPRLLAKIQAGATSKYQATINGINATEIKPEAPSAKIEIIFTAAAIKNPSSNAFGP